LFVLGRVRFGVGEGIAGFSLSDTSVFSSSLFPAYGLNALADLGCLANGRIWRSAAWHWGLRMIITYLLDILPHLAAFGRSCRMRNDRGGVREREPRAGATV
jgi:hypothetical protein